MITAPGHEIAMGYRGGQVAISTTDTFAGVSAVAAMLGLLLSIGACIFAFRSARAAEASAASAADVARIERERQEGERSATLGARFVRDGYSNLFLVIDNSGPAMARNVGVSMHPIPSHENVPKFTSRARNQFPLDLRPGGQAILPLDIPKSTRKTQSQVVEVRLGWLDDIGPKNRTVRVDRYL